MHNMNAMTEVTMHDMDPTMVHFSIIFLGPTDYVIIHLILDSTGDMGPELCSLLFKNLFQVRNSNSFL